MTDPTITIAGLRAQVATLIDHLDSANTSRGEFSSLYSQHSAKVAAAEAERDALAAQLAEVRAKLDAAPKVCSIHSYELDGPCMTCGAWPPGTRELIAACQARIAVLEQAADERSKEVARLTAQLEAAQKVIDEERAARDLLTRNLALANFGSAKAAVLTARVAELEARPVLTEERLIDALLALGVNGYEAAANASTVLRHLGPVTLPAQDRAEELIRSILSERKALMSGIGATLDDKLSDAWASDWINATRAALAALASLGAPPTSPPAARPVFAGVSEEDLADLFVSGILGAVADGSTRAVIRAVLARLEVSLVAPVDPEAVAKAYHDDKESPAPEWPYAAEYDINSPVGVDHEQARLRATSAMRAALTAAGIPVTPEVRK